MVSVENEFVEHIPCPECGSSDANSLYSDGHTFCFKCHARTHGNNTNTHNHQVSNVQLQGSARRLIIKCQMYNFKDQPDGCNQEEYLNVPVNYSKPTKMDRSYATIISTVMERLSGQRSEQRTKSSVARVK